MNEAMLYFMVLLFGICFGSFLNVCIIRLPQHMSIITEPSRCVNCGYRLQWYDLVPLVSWLALKGRCRKCSKPISKQYPIIETVNGIAWVMIVIIRGFRYELVYDLTTVCYLALFSALLVLSVIDFRTYEIPLGCNIFILAVGLIHLIMDYSNWLQYVIGLTAVSLFLYVIYVVSKGRGIGGGDVKMMAACGLLLGWKYNIIAFIVGCVLGSVIHIARMKISKKDHVLAMGPYLSMGVMISVLWGDKIIEWYLGMYS